MKRGRSERHERRRICCRPDTASFFGCEAPTEKEFRRIRADQEDEVAQAADSSAPAALSAPALVVLARGRDEVLLPAELYISALAEYGQNPPADNQHSTWALRWVAKAAEKRGLASLAKALTHLQGGDNGLVLVLVRRPDGSLFTPKPVTTIKVAQASEEGHQATAASTDLSDEVAEYLGAASEAGDVPTVRAGRAVGRRLRPLVRVDVGGLAGPEDAGE